MSDLHSAQTSSFDRCASVYTRTWAYVRELLDSRRRTILCPGCATCSTCINSCYIYDAGPRVPVTPPHGPFFSVRHTRARSVPIYRHFFLLFRARSLGVSLPSSLRTSQRRLRRRGLREYRFNASPIYMLTSKVVSVPLKSDVYVPTYYAGSRSRFNPAVPRWRTQNHGRSSTDLRAPCKLLSRFSPRCFPRLFSPRFSSVFAPSFFRRFVAFLVPLFFPSFFFILHRWKVG